MKHKIGDIVVGLIPILVDEAGKINAFVKFVGKVDSYNAEEDLVTFEQAVVQDLNSAWHNLEGGIQEYSPFIASLCDSEEFDIFHDGLKLPPTPASQYWSKIGTSLRLLVASHGDSLFDD